MALAHAIVLAISPWLVAKPAGRLSFFTRAALLYVTGAAVVFLPFALYFLAMAPVSAFAADIIDYPTHYYAAMRGLPFPRPGDLTTNPGSFGVYIPVLGVLVAGIEIVGKRGKAGRPRPGGSADPHLSFLIVFMILAALSYYKGVVRVSNLHMLMSIVPSLLLLAIGVDRWWDKPRSGRVAASLIVGIVLLLTIAAAKDRNGWRERTLAVALAHPARRLAAHGATCPSTPATMLAWEDPDYRRVGAYVRRYSRPDESIFVGLDRHDRIFINSVSLYFLAERRPGTHWYQFEPGLQTRADIQRSIIADLERNAVRWVIRDASFDAVQEPNGSSRSSGVHDLDLYLVNRYRPVVRSGPVEIWLDRNVDAPSPSRWPACFAAMTAIADAKSPTLARAKPSQ